MDEDITQWICEELAQSCSVISDKDKAGWYYTAHAISCTCLAMLSIWFHKKCLFSLTLSMTNSPESFLGEIRIENHTPLIIF